MGKNKQGPENSLQLWAKKHQAWEVFMFIKGQAGACTSADLWVDAGGQMLVLVPWGVECAPSY